MEIRRPFGLISLLITITIVGNVKGYKWTSFEAGDLIPANAVSIPFSRTYVARARHYDDILPAEINAAGSAYVSFCAKELLAKDKIEILTVSSSSSCQWKTESENENMVRVGTAWDSEPIFVISSPTDYSDYFSIHIASYLSNSDTIIYWEKYRFKEKVFLCCELKTKWINYIAPMKLPNNLVEGGYSNNGDLMFVARIKRGCDLIPGQFVAEKGTASAILYADDKPTESHYFDLLIGKPNEYIWVSAGNGDIPDYAVVQGKYKTHPVFIARFNNTIRKLTHPEALNTSNYDILVKSHL